MTKDIFPEWIELWVKELHAKKRKILLLIDNCTAHAITMQLKNIEIVYLPANTTSIFQRCNHGIIRTMKAYYQNEMRTRIIEDIEKANIANDIAKKTTLLQAIHPRGGSHIT